MGQQGRIAQVSVSAGGVPKLAVPEAEVSVLGLAGDGHRDTTNHGGPERAVCLWSMEVITALQAAGHPVRPGSTGENITIEGIAWDTVTPGMRLRLGADVVLEVTRYTTPCAKNAGSFKDGDYTHMSQQAHPGSSRVYAQVVAGGVVRTGDEVVMEG